MSVCKLEVIGGKSVSQLLTPHGAWAWLRVLRTRRNWQSIEEAMRWAAEEREEWKAHLRLVTPEVLAPVTKIPRLVLVPRKHKKRRK